MRGSKPVAGVSDWMRMLANYPAAVVRMKKAKGWPNGHRHYRERSLPAPS